MSTVMVLCNFPDYQCARDIVDKIINQKLAACANILDGCTSVFHLEGKVQVSSEIPVYFKTTLEVYSKLEIELTKLHPYELPEIIAFPVEFGYQPYLNWIEDSVLIENSNQNDNKDEADDENED